MSGAASRGGARPLRVFAVAVLGIALFSYMDALMKDLVLALGVYSAMFWRSLAGVVLSGTVYAARRPPRPSGAALRVHVVRGAISTGMAMLFFWGLARVPMAHAVALTFVAPLLSLFLSAAWLGERIDRRTIGASAVAALGVLVIAAGDWTAGGRSDAGAGTLAILASALCYAVNITLMRKQALVAGPVEVAFAQSVVVAVLLAAGAPFAASALNPSYAPLLVLAAAIATGSLMLLAWAYARAEANYLSLSEYTAFVWAALFGWLLFGEPLSVRTVVGALLVVGGCLVATRRPADLPAEALL